MAAPGSQLVSRAAVPTVTLAIAVACAVADPAATREPPPVAVASSSVPLLSPPPSSSSRSVGTVAPSLSAAAAAPSGPSTGGRVSPRAEQLPPLDRATLAVALERAAIDVKRGCGHEGGRSVTGRISLTFSHTGKVSRASVGGDLAGTPAGECVERVFRMTTLPAFGAEPVTVARNVVVTVPREQ